MSEGPGARPMVIVGGGKAGGTAAATLRDEGFNGPAVLVSREPGIPFGRPPLSKTYLRSEEDLTDWYVRPPDWYEAHDVDLRPDSVIAVDPAAHALALASGRELRYEKLLIATGGRNRRLQLPGAELPGIYYLRTVAECDAIKREAEAGRRAVVVGMGFIGCEVAASLTQLGVQVTAVFPRRNPLERVLVNSSAPSSVMFTARTASGCSREPRSWRSTGPSGSSRSCWPMGSRSGATSPSSASGSTVRCRRSRARPWPRTTGSWWTSGAAAARPTSTLPATSPTTCTRSLAASVWSTTTEPSTTGPRRRGRCWARPPPSTTSTTSSPTSTSMSSSTSATLRAWTTSPSAGAFGTASSSASTWMPGSCGPPSASTAAAIRSGSATPNWRPARAWWPAAHAPAAAC